MAISYHVYTNDGRGGAVDYTRPIATVPAASALPAAILAVGPLGRPSDNLFAVRAFDDASGVEEANTDARVRVVLDATGRDVTARPLGVRGLAARWAVGNDVLVTWGYLPAGQGGPPASFAVAATPADPAVALPPAPSVPFAPGVAGYGCRLIGLATATDWTISVTAVGPDGLGGPTASASLARPAGVLAAVEGLAAAASA